MEPRRVFVLGWPKSGTTALFYRISRSLTDPLEFFEPKGAFTQSIPAGREAVAKALFPSPVGPDEVASYLKHFPLRIRLVRDPRDFMISKFLYHFSSKEWKANQALQDHALELLRRKESDPRSVPIHTLFEDPRYAAAAAGLDRLGYRLETTRKLMDRFPGAFHSMRYEDLVAENLDKVEKYLGFALDRSDAVPSHKLRVVRSKRAGNWRQWFTEEDVAHYRAKMDPILESLGYEPEWELDPAPRITQVEASGYVLRLVTGQLPPQS